MNWPIIITCAVGISILLTIVIIPQIIRVSVARGLYDRPNERKIHKGVVPRLGGVAFLPVILLTIGIMMVVPAAFSFNCPPGYNVGFIHDLPDIMVLVAAMIIMFFTGLLDDLMGLRYGMKFIAQIAAAVLMVEAGAYIVDYYGLFGIHHTSDVIGKIITGFVIIYVVNSLNLIDGIDGLASGLSFVTLTFYGIMLFIGNYYFFALLSWVFAASVAVFWCFNVFGSAGKHTKLFMGDVGSLSLGVFIAFMAIIIVREPSVSILVSIDPLVIALSPLVIPLFDVIRVFCLRLSKGKSPFLPDKQHIHHLLMDVGFSMRKSMMTLILLQIAVVALNLWIVEYISINGILGIDLGIYILLVLALLYTGKQKEQNNIEKTKK